MPTRTAALVVLLAACGGGSGGDDTGTPDASAGPGIDARGGCPRTSGADDRVRHVVVSHPYDASGAQAPTYEVLQLSAAGALTRFGPHRTFAMGRAAMGSIAFTPDGEIGLVAQDDGTLGVFRLDAAGFPTVVHARFDGGAAPFYATRVVVDPRGDRAWVLDGNWRENGGGIYGVLIGCDGTLTATGMVAPAKLPGALAFVAGGYAIVAATDIAESSPSADVHLVRWGDQAGAVTVASGADAFASAAPIIGGAALSADGATFLVGDVSQFSSAPNRVAVVRVDGMRVTRVNEVAVEDPESIVASPFGDVAGVASVFTDALYVLEAEPPGGAWRLRGEVAYTGGTPQLPGDLAAIDRGGLRGHVLVSENLSVRQLAFRATGAIDDLGSLEFGSGLDQISGAIGVTP
jgi:hypothetical protein